MESEGQSIDPRIRSIAENRDVLLQILDVNHVLLTELSGHEILDEFTKQRITSEKKYGINERFIDWLETRSPQTIDKVLQKLRDDNQNHVANLIDGTKGERPLSDKVKQRIRKLSGWLTENMTTDHGLIDHLFAQEAINTRDCEDIKAKPTKSARAMELIDIVLRGSDRTLKILQKALVASNQNHIAEEVEKGSPSLEKNSLQTGNNMTPEQSLISPEHSHVVRSEEVVCNLVGRSHKENEESLRAKTDVGKKVDLCKIEGTKATDKTEIKEIDDNMGKRKCIVEHVKPENHQGLAVDDKVKNSVDPAIEELQLKLKLVGKEMDRKTSEITRLHERLRQLEEEKDDISKDLNEILELNTGDRDRVIVHLKQRVRELEKEKEQLSIALEEAKFAQQQTKEEYGVLKDGHYKLSHNLQKSSLLRITKEIKTEANEGARWSELKQFIVLATDVTLNGKNLIHLLFLILRNTKSPKETIASLMLIYLFCFQPLLLHLPVGIPDDISSFCFTHTSAIFCGSLTLVFIYALILEREDFCKNMVFSLSLLCYFCSDKFDPGAGVGRYCQEDKCVYVFYWEYLANNMRIGEEAVDQLQAQNFNGAGGLSKSPAAFAVWNKYTSHRWDEEMREYTQDGRFIRKINTKLLLGTAPFHLLTVFRLSRGLVSAGHGSLFYDDPMLKLCLLDAEGNIIKALGGEFGPSKGVPIVLDADREGCIIVADQMSGKMMTLCADEEHMKQLQHKVHEQNSPFDMCLHS